MFCLLVVLVRLVVTNWNRVSVVLRLLMTLRVTMLGGGRPLELVSELLPS